MVVPYARLGIVGSVFLALARALGETMAVTMVIGNTPQIKVHCSLQAIPSQPSSPMNLRKRREISISALS